LRANQPEAEEANTLFESKMTATNRNRKASLVIFANTARTDLREYVPGERCGQSRINGSGERRTDFDAVELGRQSA